MERLAVLITCHNRRDTTLKSLAALLDQELPSDSEIKVFLVDDGSSDGTGEAVNKLYPRVRLLRGDGELYWCGGMRLAWEEAMKEDFSAFLWLNDDTVLLPGALRGLLETLSIKRKDECGIVIGTSLDSRSGDPSYGGRLRKNPGKIVKASGTPQECDLINGNIVLVPDTVAEKIGNLSREFRHTSADNDYGERAKKAGFRLWVAPGFHGLCDSHAGSPWTNPDIPLKERWKFLHSPKGQPPYEIYVYARRHSGIFWPMDLIKLYIRVLVPGLYNRVRNRFNRVSAS